MFTAPGTYRPENFNLDKGPEYSITSKHYFDKTDNVPGNYILNEKKKKRCLHSVNES